MTVWILYTTMPLRRRRPVSYSIDFLCEFFSCRSVRVPPLQITLFESSHSFRAEVRDWHKLGSSKLTTRWYRFPHHSWFNLVGDGLGMCQAFIKKWRGGWSPVGLLYHVFHIKEETLARLCSVNVTFRPASYHISKRSLFVSQICAFTQFQVWFYTIGARIL